MDRYTVTLLDSSLLAIQRCALVVTPMVKDLIIGLLGDGSSHQQKDDAGET